jgi:peroxiredoxin
MRAIFAGALALGFGFAAVAPALASLAIGTKAPDFTAQATLGGDHFTFALKSALKKGPVVLYFYPAAFTHGCTIEAHEFAEAAPDFQKLGASVIGVSHDDIATLDKFSTTECKKAFPVAADTDQHIMKAYDSIMQGNPAYASRTSYVIAPTGEVLYAFTDGDPTHHVENTMNAVKTWVSAHPKH